MSEQSSLNRWAEALAGVARTGLAFTTSSYEVERYEEILSIAADMKAKVDRLDEAAALIEPDLVRTPALVAEAWRASVGDRTAGYVTPKIAIGAVVGDDEGRILLIKRADSGVWLYPTGWADIGYSAAEVAVKEVEEETGISCEVVRLLAVIDGLQAGFSRTPLYSLVFLCRATGGEVTPHPEECLDAGWFSQDDLPSPMANIELWGDYAFRSIRGEVFDTIYDPPRPSVWEQS